LPTAAPAAGERKWILLLSGDFSQRSSGFSPDGRFFFYAARESGREEIFVQKFDPKAPAGSGNGGKWKISEGGGLNARWRADGKELLYLARNGNMMSVAVSTSPVFRAEAPKRLFNVPGFSLDWDAAADGQKFLFFLNQQEPHPYTVVLNWTSLLVNR